MPSSYTGSARFTKQGIGENDNTWGTIANTQYDLIDTNINGVLTLNVTTGSDITLTANNGSSDEARNAVLKLSGTPTSQISVITPAVAKKYTVDATLLAGSYGVLVKPTGSGDGVLFTAGQTGEIYCDGTDMILIYRTVETFKTGDIKMTTGTIAAALIANPGWGACDGTNGTVDLRDKFIVAAKQDDSGVAKTNISGSLTVSGGSTTSGSGGAVSADVTGSTTLTSANIPTLSSSSSTVLTMDGDGTPVVYGGGTRTLFQKIIQFVNNSVSGHTHTTPAISAHTHSVLPPYYAVIFLQKL